MNAHEYWTEIKSIVDQVKADTLEQGFTWDGDAEEYADQCLYEVIDGHEFCIYYSKALEVLQHTDNQDAMFDSLGAESAESAAQALRDAGLGGLHCPMAVWAMIADCTSHSDWAPSEWIVEEEGQDDEE
jgi:hypothetical protein